MSAAHTPGPWRIGSSRSGVFAGEKLVASVYGDSDGCEPDERMAANATLIASAPDTAANLSAITADRDRLREALRSAAMALEDVANGHHYGASFAMLAARQALEQSK